MSVMNRRVVRAFLVLGGLLGGVTAAAVAQQGAVAGQVTDQATGQPIVGARVTVVGTALIDATNAEGRYRLRNVRPGQVTLRMSAVGYGAATRSVVVPPGDTATVDQALSLQPYSLDEVVVTATGDQAKREVGNTVSRLNADSLVLRSPIASMTDLLGGGKVPGMHVLQGTVTGAPSRVRIRGTNSLSLTNEPIYVVDGVRITSANRSSSVCNVGCAPPSRLNDLNPEEIASVEVVKGPSAAALYGTDAANGVVVIKTKRGKAGPPRWTVYVEQGIIKDYNDYPSAYRGWRTGTTSTTNSTPTNTVQCRLYQSAAGTCVQDSVTAYNLFEDPESSPNGTGRRQQYGVQVSGGSELVQYFVSGEWENELGYLDMPPFARQRLVTNRAVPNEDAIPNEQLRPNALRKTSLRANLEASLNPRLDLSASTGFISSDLRVPATDNNTTGLLSNALGGLGNKTNGRNGYRTFTPDQMFSEGIGQDINRFIGSGTANWRPTSWLAVRLTGGIDFTSRVDTDLCRRGQCTTFNQTTITGFKEDNRTVFFQYTGDASATASFSVSPVLTSRTTVGVQYFEGLFDRNGAFGEDLPPGATTVTSASILDADELTTESKTLGGFIEQHFGYKDRLFVTGALRADDNSAFGTNFSAVYYPKLGVSYVISEEPFFPRWSWLNSLRLRGAFGASGVQPGSTDALRFFAPTTATIDGTDTPALIFDAIGNPDLKPERAREYEIGGEATLFDNRVNLEFTYYNKRTKDALIARIVAPSVGASTTRFENLGAVVNRGIETALSARIIDRPEFGWDLSVNAAYNTNFIADMGGVAPIIGTTTRQIQGFPINGWWQRPYTYRDANGDGIIVGSEITVADSAEFVGYANPRWEVSYLTGFDLFNRRLRVSGLFDHKSGYYQLNGTERIRCQNRFNCRGLLDPKAPLWEQARIVALLETGTATQWGFIEKATFVRLREASATYELPAAWARAFRAARLSVTVAGRNLWQATGWSGIDPEANYFEGATGIVSNFQTAPPPTYWTVRVNATY
ncbi:MAG: SusC/RagA family TonB-linked outer membrane protein [Gemmatimonadales bacterium]